MEKTIQAILQGTRDNINKDRSKMTTDINKHIEKYHINAM